jgi:hypothetical protein
MIKTQPFLIRAATLAAVASLGFVFSCSDDEPEFSTEASYAAEETSIDAYYADADDMAGVAVAESEETEGGKISPGARTLEINDDRFCGVSVTLDLDLSLPLMPVGDITIDFGNACEDPNGNVRRGKINVHFRGRKFRPGSVISISFENYEINGARLNGTRTLTNLQTSTVEAPKFQIELVDGSVSWNGKTATREHCFVTTWDRGIILAPGDDQLKISQCSGATVAAEGINRNGIHYKVFIEEELVYKRGCPMAVSGIKKFIEVNSGKEILIDYGNGTCDRNITITVNGNIRNIRSRR